MNRRISIVLTMCLLTVAGAWLFWSQAHNRQRTSVTGNGARAGATVAAKNAAAGSPKGAATASSAKVSTLNTNKLAYRLANTTNSIRQLETKPHAILLANAFIDTDKPLDLKIPAHLRSAGDPGAYIVQSRGPIDARFRNTLLAAGAQVVSYIPNNAYLVNVAASGAGRLAGNPLVQAVLPYEPYYKLQSSLLGLAVEEKPLPPGTALTLGLFAADAAAGEAQLAALGAKIIGHDQSPFGPVVRVLAPTDWTTLVQSPVVQFAEPAHARVVANDLARVTLGISVDTLAPTNYLNLYGSNVLVAVNDSGVDINHPDFTTGGSPATGPGGAPIRVTGLTLLDMVDTNGHGTHVAGIIAGNGAASWGTGLSENPQINVGTYAEGSISNADFRGKAPLANLFSLNTASYTDYQLQTNAARAGALISNNSWDYGNGATEYDLAAASYDFATRDALPGTTGSQPVLFVFAAGNQGGGSDDGTGGNGDTILSPGTAKNVITVGAIEQFRNITNLVSTITGASGTNAPTTNQVAYWQPETDSGTQVASFSSRGNVGIGIEGSYGRFKPDVVSPGTFVVSTSSQFNDEWNTNAYYNPSNTLATVYQDQVVTSNGLAYYNVPVPPNAAAINISVYPNNLSPKPFPNLPIYCQVTGVPDPVGAPGLIDITSYTNGVSIPPGGGNCTLPALDGNGFNLAIGNTNNFTVNYNLTIQILVTNSEGDLYSVLEGMNDSLGGYYRYETGTSMAAASVSGVLALIQDYFMNQFQPPIVPSPALLKAVLINGARSVGGNGLALTNGVNFEGWGLENIQNCVPAGGLFSQFSSLEGSSFFVDQNPTNALATGDSHTYTLNLDTNGLAQLYQLQATLVWTDPPGDPAAAIKLVNSLELVITNLDTGDVDFGSVYIGNDISPDVGYNQPWNTNYPPNVDTINNVQTILLPALLAGQYSVTVVGRSVNVNAVTAQTNNALGHFAPNIVQDYALVVSVGEGEVTNAFSVKDNGIASNPTGGQDFTVVLTTNAPLMDQLVGASSPLLGTNRMPLGTDTIWGPNGVVTIGQTNQWHFYVVTNTGLAADYTNAAFLTFQVDTLSIPRMGVYETTQANATKPEANLDMFVTEDPSITNLNPVAISNCLAGVGNSRASLYNAGTQFVYYTNSVAGQSVYYIGVQSQDQMASEYAFLPVFTDVPFSSLDQNGNQIVNGLLLPTATPMGNNAHPGQTNIFALAILPMTVEQVTVTNLDEHQNFGDLVGSLSFSEQYAMLNNHDGFGNTFGSAPIVYDDSPNHPLGTTNTDGPGTLMNFRAKSALGPWILNILDDSAGGFSGQVSRFTLLIQPHRNLLLPGVIVSVPAGGWFVDWVDVPAGYTNLTFYGTNVMIPPAPQPIQMYERFGSDPTLTNYDQEVGLTNGNPEGNSISVGPPLAQGRYFVGLYNPNAIAQNVFLSATLGVNSTVNDIYNYSSASGQTLFDDAVTPTPGPDPAVPTVNPLMPGSTITVPKTVTNLVTSVNVGLVINSPRISDYAFTLVSPTGQRVLLMENRGGGDTNGAGLMFVYTNVINSTATGGAAANTNYLPVSPQGEVVPITWNFYTVPDQMTVYDTTNPALFNPNSVYCLYNTGMTNNPTAGPGSQDTVPFTEDLGVPAGVTNLTIIMNQFGNPDATHGDAWIYTAGAATTNYEYLEFTDSTNLATLPIKFAPPPFNLIAGATNFALSDLDLAMATNYFGPTNLADGFGTGWSVPTNLVLVTTVETNAQFVLVTNVLVLSNNLVSVMTDPSTAVTGDAGGSNYLALGNGTITRAIPTVPGQTYNVTFWYRGPGIAGWWRGEGNALDSSDPENDNNNGTLVGRFNFPAGEVDQALEFEDPGNPYQFAGTNTYVQVPASASLNVGAGGGFTVEGWINPTNLLRPEPLVEWLAQVPTNPATADTNLAIVQGPVLNPATGHFYYLLAPANWSTSERWAQELGGDLVTLETANEQEWVYDTFTAYGTTNRDLWTGLQEVGGTFRWVSGVTSIAYTNWAPGQPGGACPGDTLVAIMGPTNAYPGLWQLEGDNGQTCSLAPTNPIFGVVEVSALPTNGVQFWISGTNWTPGQTNTLSGSLCGNIVDTNGVSHWIVSAPGLLLTNVYQHVALTFNTNSGVAALYLNGTNVATSNLYSSGVSFTPKTDGDLLLGWDMSLYTNNFYVGEMDEMSVYERALSLAEIAAIYHVSADTTNRLVGKFDPAITPAVGLAEATVQFGATSNVIFGVNDQWEVNSYTFTATSNSMPLTISGIAPGMLLDAFAVQTAPATNLYYFPEQALAGLNGTPADGNWTLQIWDSRAGAFVTNANQLVNWQLSFVLDTNALVSASLPPETPVTTTVPSGQIVYYSVTVPAWAHAATNILVSSSQPVNVYFNETNLPTGSSPGDYTLLTAATSGVGAPILVTNGTPPLLPGTYYLGVRNNSAHSATVALEVDYDLLSLTNGVPFTDVLTNEYTAVRYFAYDVGSNAYEATFQLLQLSGNADLVVSRGAPLPALNNEAYGSFNVSTADENIYVLTNSAPVPLAAGRWYLGVVSRDGTPITYSVLAKELDLTNNVITNGLMPAIIELTNGLPYTCTAGPGAALTNFFHFHATNALVNGTNVALIGLRFELFNLSGNGDLTVQTNRLPLAPPFNQTSQNGGTTPELIFVFTNNVLTNLAADWYLGVPNREVTNISYSLVVEVMTNLYFPAFPGAEGAGGGAVGGRFGDVYHVTTTQDAVPGSLRAAVTSAGTNRTVVFDTSGTMELLTPLVITNSGLTLAGETAPGGGITVAGQLMKVQSAHDVVIRDLRFRSIFGNYQQTVWYNGFEGGVGTPTNGDYFAGGWHVDFGSVDVIYTGSYGGATAYQGAAFLDLDGNSAGGISTNIVTTPGAVYSLDLAYTRNPDSLGDGFIPLASVLINGQQIAELFPNYKNTWPNLNWQYVSYVFTATSASTHLAVRSLDSAPDNTGVLLDAFSLATNAIGYYDFQGAVAGPYPTPQVVNGWTVLANQVSVVTDPTHAFIGHTNYLALGTGVVSNGLPTFIGRVYTFTVAYTGSPTQSFAQAVLSLPGITNSTLVTTSTNWQQLSFTFTATSGSTPVVIRGVQPGLLLDGVAAESSGGLGGALEFNTVSNAIVDHVSASWSTNAELAVFASTNVTVQWSILADSLYALNYPGLGSLLQEGSGTLSLHHNLYADIYSGSPQLGGNLTLDFVNNVIYNWGVFSGLSDGTNDLQLGSPGLTNGLNYVGNYLIAGADTADYSANHYNITNIAFFGGVTNALAALWIFQTNNFIDSDTNRVLNGSATGWGMFTNDYSRLGRAFPTPTLSVDEAYQAYEKVLDFAGTSLALRDSADSNIVTGVRYQTGRIISGSPNLPGLAVQLPYLDTDQDGIPDFWEATFTPALVYVPSNNHDRDGDGYTDLEEYNNWLAVPHALTMTNTPVGVDLYQLYGRSGHLAFCVTNSINGVVYLTNVLGSVTNTSPSWSNSIAVFTPTNSAAGGTNYFGYASFACYVTNLDTAAYFGPVTVSVLVSAVPITFNSNMPPVIITLSSGVASDPTNYGGSDYYHVVVSTNDYGALFELDNPTGPMAMVLGYGLPPPSLSSYAYYTNAPAFPANQEIAVFTNSRPVPLQPGDWYMAAVNESGSKVVYTAKITLFKKIYPPAFLYPSNSMVFTTFQTVPLTIPCVALDTNQPPLPLSFALVSGPPNLVVGNGVIYWTPTEAQAPSTNSVLVSVSNGGISVTNAFSIIVEVSNAPPVLPTIPNQTVLVPGGQLLVTNTAWNPNVPANPLTYALTTTVTGGNHPSIDGNGVITWSPSSAEANTSYLFTTVVSDYVPLAVNGAVVSSTNHFQVIVLSTPPVPPGQPQTNVTAPGSISWFPVLVPADAIAATNTLLLASRPVNLWYSTNQPPETNHPGDTELLSQVTSGVSVLSTNLATAPTNLVPGGLYFLGVQNNSGAPVTNALQIDFAYAVPSGPTLPVIPDQQVFAGDTLVVTNTASDANANAVLHYTLVTKPSGAGINSSGIITWPTPPGIGPASFVITTVVYDSIDNLSATNSFNVLVLPTLPPGPPATNVVGPNGLSWFLVQVPTNAVQATNTLVFASAPVNLWFSTNMPPTISSPADAELLANSIGGVSVLNPNTVPVLVPGSRYSLGVENPGSVAVTNVLRVTFQLAAPPAFQLDIFSIVPTNNPAGSNGFLITWYAPTNQQFHLQWTPSLAPASWTNFNGVISFTTYLQPEYSLFQYFDDGTQTGGFASTRYYRLLQLISSTNNTAPFFISTPGWFNVATNGSFLYTNTAQDWDVPAQLLTYTVTNTLADGTNTLALTNSLAAISVAINPTNGVITWTPNESLLGWTNFITTTVTDNGVPPKSATNLLAVVVSTNAAGPFGHLTGGNAAPQFARIAFGAHGVQFQWTAPQNDRFQLRWTTNLVSAKWQSFPNVITSTNTSFSFVDTNTPLWRMKFYQLLVLP